MTAHSIYEVNHRRGVFYAALGVAVLSFDALLIRLADTDPASATFWRGLLIGISLCTFLAATGRWSQWSTVGEKWRTALPILVLYGVNTALFVYSITLTRVANAVVILCCSSFFAAFFSWWLLQEKINRRTWYAIMVSVIGVMLVFAGSIDQIFWKGDLLALILSASMGLILTLLRREPTLPKVPVVAGSGFVAALLVVPFASPLAVSGESMMWLGLMGLLQMPVASVMIMMATRYLPSPEVSLFLLIETVLGPVWVWLVLAEAAPGNTLAGGTLILSAILFHALSSLREERHRK